MKTDYKTIWLNSGRNCLKYIIKAYGIKEIFIPYYLCTAIRNAATKENCLVKLYHIDDNFMPITDFPPESYILYPNYWGICSKNIEILVNKYPNLIIDNAHSFYSEPKGLTSFNSLRKFFPNLRNGAILHIKKIIADFFNTDSYNYENKLLNYQEICENETRLDKAPILYMSNYTKEYFNSINFEKEKQKRLQKFQFFNEKYGNKNLLNINARSNDIPFCYPYLALNEAIADKEVQELVKTDINIYRYWHNLPKTYNENKFYKRLIPIPLL